MDIFTEHIVRHKKGTKEILISVGAVLAAVILSLALVAFGQVLFQFGIGLLFLAAFIYGAYIVIKFTSVEFEYILTNNELDIDKIMARSRRKRLITIDFKSIDICAPVDAPDYKHEFENTSLITKTFDCTGMGNNRTYFADFDGTAGKVRVLFEPTEKILEGAYKFNPRKVIK